jgi:hypothetical protein
MQPYFANNPVNRVDPTGEFVIILTTRIIIGIIAGAAIGAGSGAYYSYKKFGKVTMAQSKRLACKAILSETI